MSDKTATREVSAIDVEAASWIAQLSDDDFSEADHAALREWCLASPAHREALTRLGKLWAEMDALGDLPDRLAATTSARDTGRRPHRNYFWAAPALMTLALVLAGVWLIDRARHAPGDELPQMHTTGIGEQRLLELEDGSRIHLNTNSLVEIDFGAQERRVRLVKGEAMFDVAKDGNRPFRVHAATSSFRAIGTQFAVRFRQDLVQIIVSEGTVEVTGSTGPSQPPSMFLLESNQMATVGEQKPASVAIQPLPITDLQRRLSWTKGVLDFDGEPLSEVISEVSRYTDLDIEILDANLRAVQVGGRFQIGETEALFDVIESSFGAKVTKWNNSVLITAK